MEDLASKQNPDVNTLLLVRVCQLCLASLFTQIIPYHEFWAAWMEFVCQESTAPCTHHLADSTVCALESVQGPISSPLLEHLILGTLKKPRAINQYLHS